MRQIGTPTIVVRPASAADAPAIVDLHFAAVHETASVLYPAEVITRWAKLPDEMRFQQVRDAISQADELLVVAEKISEVIGFGSIISRLQELRAVYVLGIDEGGLALVLITIFVIIFIFCLVMPCC